MGGMFASYFGKGGGGGITPSSSASATASSGLTSDTSKVVNFGSSSTGLALAVGAVAVIAVIVVLKK